MMELFIKSLNNLAKHQSKSQQLIPESQPISQQSVPHEITSEETVKIKTLKTP